MGSYGFSRLYHLMKGLRGIDLVSVAIENSTKLIPITKEYCDWLNSVSWRIGLTRPWRFFPYSVTTIMVNLYLHSYDYEGVGVYFIYTIICMVVLTFLYNVTSRVARNNQFIDCVMLSVFQ